MTTSPIAPVVPDDHGDASMASAALPRIKRHLAHHPDAVVVRALTDDAGDDLVLPRGAVELLARVLAHMAAGESVTVVPDHAELTTQQAADVLNVSRPYLIKLLDTEEITYRRVGKHRRIRADSLMEYMRRDDARRRGAADELSALTQELGLA